MPDLSIITNRKYRKRLRNLVEKLSSVKNSSKEDLLELPEDRKYTMRPEWQEAYSKLMGQYATFEAQDAVDDIRDSVGMTEEEREARIKLAKERINKDKELYKDADLKTLKKFHSEWIQNQLMKPMELSKDA